MNFRRRSRRPKAFQSVSGVPQFGAAVWGSNPLLPEAEFGIDLVACGLKDIVLPGEIKAILIKAAEAERAAQASLITAREELAATRCQLNTAKLISENPAILRLKELQVLAEAGHQQRWNVGRFTTARSRIVTP